MQPEKHKTPVENADMVFKESQTALMAHSIQAVIRLFQKSSILLHVQVIPDKLNILHTGATSMLSIAPHKAKDEGEYNRVDATIHIHKDANKHLARLCITHEIHHLLMSFENYKKTSRWEPLLRTREIEDQCDQFAWDLCFKHDDFYHNPDKQNKYIFFPPKTFGDTLKTRSLANQKDWPEGINLDPDNPFWKF